MIIAIDGPLAAGKGTIARALATRFGLRYLDTGSLYRAVAVAVARAGGDLDDPTQAEAAAVGLDLDAIDEAAIRSAAAGQGASRVAAMPGVRAALLDLQRRFAATPPGAVLDGRDIGTVVCPHADVKLYITADETARAQRRRDELAAKGEDLSLTDMLAQLRERDARDAARAAAPMRPADDAHLLDTTGLSIEAAIEAACAIIKDDRRMAARSV
jgi:cytidylate kinase